MNLHTKQHPVALPAWQGLRVSNDPHAEFTVAEKRRVLHFSILAMLVPGHREPTAEHLQVFERALEELLATGVVVGKLTPEPTSFPMALVENGQRCTLMAVLFVDIDGVSGDDAIPFLNKALGFRGFIREGEMPSDLWPGIEACQAWPAEAHTHVAFKGEDYALHQLAMVDPTMRFACVNKDGHAVTTFRVSFPMIVMRDKTVVLRAIENEARNAIERWWTTREPKKAS